MKDLLQTTRSDNSVNLPVRAGTGTFDITAQDRLMETLIRSTVDGIIVINSVGKVLLQNPAWLDVTGVSAIDVPLVHVASHFGLYRVDQVTPLRSEELACHRALLGETVQDQEIFQRTAQRPEGRWLNGSGTPLRDEAGAIWGAVGVIRDVTATKRAELVQAHLAALVDTSGLAIVVLKPDGIIQDWSPGAEQILGYRADELVGLPASVLTVPDHASDFEHAKAELIKGRSVHTYETVGRHRAGELIEISVILAPIKDRLGRLVGFYGIATDISARRKLEQRLAALAHQERLNWGHELHDTLGQQLSAIGLLINALKDALPRTRPAKLSLLARLDAAVDEAKLHIRDIANGLSPVDIDARGLVVALDELAHKTTAEQGIACRFEASNTVTIPNNLVATQLYFIAREGVTNAVLHARATEISVQLSATARALRLAVRDNGRGLPREAERNGGTGVDIMRHRSGLVGGTLRMKSAHGGGTLLTCHIQDPDLKRSIRGQ